MLIGIALTIGLVVPAVIFARLIARECPRPDPFRDGECGDWPRVDDLKTSHSIGVSGKGKSDHA